MNEAHPTERSEELYIDIPFEEFPLKVMGAFRTEEGESIELPWATVDFDPSVGLTFTYLPETLAELSGAKTRVHTSNKQELFLYRNKEGVPDQSFWKLVRSHFFEFAVQSNYRRAETEGQLEFDNWVLSGDALKGHTNERSSKVKNLKDGRILVTVDATTQFEGSVPAIDALMMATVGYTMTSSKTDGQVIQPIPEYGFQYASPIGLDQLLVHEELFREMLDLVWCRGHGVPVVYLKLGDKKSRLLRKGVHVPNATDTYRALQYDRYLKVKEVNRSTTFVQDHLLEWTNAWFSMTDAERRPFIQAALLLRNPTMQTDLRFAMVIHCLEALDKLNEKSKASRKPLAKPRRYLPNGKLIKPGSLADRLLNLAPRWTDIRRPQTISALPHLIRLAYTRNDIIHIESHSELLPGDLIEDTQITRAYYEGMVMVRAHFLDKMGLPSTVGDEYAHSALNELALINYKYS